jgi:hypothetical protein
VSTAKLIQARDPTLLTEAQFSQLVGEVARLGSWRKYHTFNSRRSAHGFPDLVLIRAPRLIFAELKTESGKTTAEQDVWLEALRALEGPTKGLVQTYVWRPHDFDSIVETLTGRRPVHREAA